jgi:hypothetical protein
MIFLNRQAVEIPDLEIGRVIMLEPQEVIDRCEDTVAYLIEQRNNRIAEIVREKRDVEMRRWWRRLFKSKLSPREELQIVFQSVIKEAGEPKEKFNAMMQSAVKLKFLADSCPEGEKVPVPPGDWNNLYLGGKHGV